MKLDRYQVAEFENHWSGCFLLAPDNQIFSVATVDIAHKQVGGRVHRPDGKVDVKSYSMEELEPLVLPAGFYYMDPGHVQCFYKAPTQTHKRGINNGNAVIGTPALIGTDISIRTTGVDGLKISRVYRDLKNPTKLGTVELKNMLDSMAKGVDFSIPFGRIYIALRQVNEKAKTSRVVVCNASGPIGHWTDGVIRLHPKVSYMYDSVCEEVNERMVEKVEVRV